jgi:hypothetical protein
VLSSSIFFLLYFAFARISSTSMARKSQKKPGKSLKVMAFAGSGVEFCKNDAHRLVAKLIQQSDVRRRWPFYSNAAPCQRRPVQTRSTEQQADAAPVSVSCNIR